MKRISKDDSARINECIARLETELGGLAEKHAIMASAIEDYNAVIDAYNGVLEEARGIANDIASEIDAYISERSDKWQEGDTGQAYGAWKDAWEGLDLTDLDVVEESDLPEPDHVDELNNLPSEPDA